MMMLLIGIYFIYPEKYIWGIQEYRIVFILNISLIIAIIIKYKKISICDDRYSIFMFLLAGSYFLSMLYAKGDSEIAWNAGMVFWKAVVLWVMIKNILSKDILNVDLFLWTCMVSLCILSMWGIEQYLHGNVRLENFGGSQVRGSNQIASAFIWGLPVAYFKTVSESGYKRYVGFVCLIVLILGIIFTESRQAFLALFFYVCCLFIVTRRKLFYVTTVFVITLFIIPFVPSSYWDRVESIGRYSEDSSALGRIEMWTIALDMFTDSPVLGVGPDNFVVIAHKYAGFGQRIRVTHNTFLQILSELGMLGITIFCVLMSYTLISLWRISKVETVKLSPSNYIQSYSMAMFMSLVGVLICCIFQNKADHEFIYWPAAVASALVSIRQRIFDKNVEHHKDDCFLMKLKREE